MSPPEQGKTHFEVLRADTSARCESAEHERICVFKAFLPVLRAHRKADRPRGHRAEGSVDLRIERPHGRVNVLIIAQETRGQGLRSCMARLIRAADFTRHLGGPLDARTERAAVGIDLRRIGRREERTANGGVRRPVRVVGVEKGDHARRDVLIEREEGTVPDLKRQQCEGLDRVPCVGTILGRQRCAIDELITDECMSAVPLVAQALTGIDLMCCALIV